MSGTLFCLTEEKSNEVRQMPKDAHGLDHVDRKLLELLTQNAEQSYADLGLAVGLSAPAVHERVKRYKASGRITAVTAQLDPAMTGKRFLAFFHVNTIGWGKSDALMCIATLPEVEEIHSVTGDTCMILKVRMESTQAMEALLARLYALPEVVSTKSYVALSTYLERPVQAGVSASISEG
ncbi:Lrp/AsnC family transcriptional regulator [Palleronia caenipelagi]|uniref:Lrp/AsnC family transcriptional regulator n=1 Tax=Palleronia caenipelagi TaxID=2489174 RepID=A0A547PN42_9RHOB|nr:Lrp/AsnC family transcriptional regulator [Palleronia caenipelagi]TRD15567.1 Lrp/AsnC family transcriptional regulator [Palleronia caenipelagi]